MPGHLVLVLPGSKSKGDPIPDDDELTNEETKQ